MSELSEQQIDEIEKRAAGATPGPWDYHGYTLSYHIAQIRDGHYHLSPRVVHATLGTDVRKPNDLEKGAGGVRKMADALFIAHSRVDVPALCETVRSLRKRTASEWQPIETAPLDQSALIFIPSPVAEHYGPAIYRGLCVENTNHERVWKTTALHSGRDCGANYWPTLWMPLPDPPKG